MKLETLYAYVSRGLLTIERADNGVSTFDPLEVEAFAASRGRGAGAGRPRSGAQGRPIMVLDSDLALIENDHLYFRGVPAAALANRLSFEQAVEYLWHGPESTGAGHRHGHIGGHGHPAAPDRVDPNNFAARRGPKTGEGRADFVSRPGVVSAVRRAARSFGPAARLADRLSLTVTVCGSFDENRGSVHPVAVRTAGRFMIASMVDALSDIGDAAPMSGSLAERLWSKLTPNSPTFDNVRLLNSTLVMCMEHDLAISTMAARVAASARADPYAAVVAALGSFDSALHGAASIAAADMIAETMRTGNAEKALTVQLTRSGVIPGFGHLLYRHADPRAVFLLRAMRRLSSFESVIAAVDRLTAVVDMRSPRPINLDLALGAFVVGAELRPDAGELMFAVARAAGWVAHIIDEYAQPALRLRPESRYTGARPAAHAPE